MKPKTPQAPQLSSLQTGDFFLEDELIFTHLKTIEQDQSYLTANNLVIKHSQLEKVSLRNARLERFEASDVLFSHCDFANLECFGASFRRVIFQNCKLTGTNFAESYLQDCQFIDCLADLASFSNTKQRVVTFTGCDLKDTDFYEMEWKNLILDHNRLSGSNWYRTSLANLNFSSNQFEQITLSTEQLKGLIVNQEQALVIAGGLGLRID
ncbi:MAG: pentapeptide repeat-containing protein [Enterococcus sp.]